MAYSQQQIDRIHSQRLAVAGRIYLGPKGVLYSGSKLGHLIQEEVLGGDLRGTTLAAKLNLGEYNIEDLVDLLDSGGGDKHFVFQQSVAESVWTIEHNMGKKPSVIIVDSGDNVVEGCEVYIDDNNMEIQFGSPFTGKAYLN